MHHDAASCLLLDRMVPANVVAMAVGADDDFGISNIKSSLFDEPDGGLQICLIPCVDQGLCVAVKDKMIAVQPPALNKEEVFPYRDDRVHI
jgi:hypothetical protein